MSDPKHPVKIVIVVENGCINQIIMDKPINARIFVADYDSRDDLDGKDTRGRVRNLEERADVWIDTPEIRAIFNKGGV